MAGKSDRRSPKIRDLDLEKIREAKLSDAIEVLDKKVTAFVSELNDIRNKIRVSSILRDCVRIDRVGTNRNRESRVRNLSLRKTNTLETKSDKHRGLKPNAKVNNSNN